VGKPKPVPSDGVKPAWIGCFATILVGVAAAAATYFHHDPQISSPPATITSPPPSQATQESPNYTQTPDIIIRHFTYQPEPRGFHVDGIVRGNTNNDLFYIVVEPEGSSEWYASAPIAVRTDGTWSTFVPVPASDSRPLTLEPLLAESYSENPPALARKPEHGPHHHFPSIRGLWPLSRHFMFFPHHAVTVTPPNT
jgi:hypothetical protein